MISKAGSNVTRGSDTKNSFGSNEVNIKAISNFERIGERVARRRCKGVRALEMGEVGLEVLQQLFVRLCL